jgi:hypothetical protein
MMVMIVMVMMIMMVPDSTVRNSRYLPSLLTTMRTHPSGLFDFLAVLPIILGSGPLGVFLDRTPIMVMIVVTRMGRGSRCCHD